MTYYSSSVSGTVALLNYISTTLQANSWVGSGSLTLTAPAGSGLAGLVLNWNNSPTVEGCGLTVSGTGFSPSFNIFINQVGAGTIAVRMSVTSKNIFIWAQSTAANNPIDTQKTIGMFGATTMLPYYATDNVNSRPIVVFGTCNSTTGTTANYSQYPVFMQNTPGVGQQWAPARLMTLIPTLEDLGSSVSVSYNPTTAGGIVAFPYVVFSENTGVRGVLENMYFLRNTTGGSDPWNTIAVGSLASPTEVTAGTATFTIAGNTYRVQYPGRGTSSTDVTCFGSAPNFLSEPSNTQILIRE